MAHLMTLLLLLVAASVHSGAASAFVFPRHASSTLTTRSGSILRGTSPSSSSDEQTNDSNNDPVFKYYNRQQEDDDDVIVTQEMLWRDLLGDGNARVSRRTKKGGSFRTLDNRDSLPFVVKVMTPDPYNTIPSSEKTKKKTRRNGRKRNDPLGGGIAQPRRDSIHKILGSFSLDKDTGPGDLLEVGEKEYEVQKARCQYKYAGGKRFVMVRKILEVKEVVRVAEESYLSRQLLKAETLNNDPPQLE